ncbi:THUMP domain-containing class I SAM-dependent RNA methyltransferase [Halobacteriovorax marinus]|uniref:THUMP domain-containing class I SAM-dependent RNA methyltransferase n=1 Tax=Halobacteriovorax marinus TaxID=97084 RepID=UPI003A93945B
MNKKRTREKVSESERLSWYFASCPGGLEELLLEEIKKFDGEDFQQFTGGIRFKAKQWNVIELIINSRLASRVYLEVHQYKFEKDSDHYALAKDKWWHHLFSVNQTFKISTLFDRDANKFFNNSMVMSLRLKDAIVDSFRQNVGPRPNISKDAPDISFLQRIEGIKGQKGWFNRIYLDLCGSPLSHRGYRPHGHEAPMRENLASAIIQSTDWNKDEDIFMDPMCGSGTIIIEALYLAANLPGAWIKLLPIVKKSQVFAFQDHLWYKREEHQERLEEYAMDLLKKGEESINQLPGGQFFGSDISNKALSVFRKSMRLANFPEDLVEIHNADALELKPFDEAPGIVITNPPYGERLAQEEDLPAFYHDLGENFKANYKGFRCYVLTSDQEYRKAISLQTSMRKPFFNGGIECRLLKYDIR